MFILQNTCSLQNDQWHAHDLSYLSVTVSIIYRYIQTNQRIENTQKWKQNKTIYRLYIPSYTIVTHTHIYVYRYIVPLRKKNTFSAGALSRELQHRMAVALARARYKLSAFTIQCARALAITLSRLSREINDLSLAFFLLSTIIHSSNCMYVHRNILLYTRVFFYKHTYIEFWFPFGSCRWYRRIHRR